MIQVQYHFPSCVCFIDRTHLGIAVKPERHREEYWTWKQSDAVHALIFCDDVCLIRPIIVGWLPLYMTTECRRIVRFFGEEKVFWTKEVWVW